MLNWSLHHTSTIFQNMEKSGLGLQPYWNLRSMPHGPDLTLPGLKLQIVSTSCDCFPTSCDFSVACAPARIKTSKVRAISGTWYATWGMSNATQHMCFAMCHNLNMLFELSENWQMACCLWGWWWRCHSCSDLLLHLVQITRHLEASKWDFHAFQDGSVYTKKKRL